MINLLKKYRRNKDGATAVSFALNAGLVIILTGATIEMGVAFWQWNTVQQAARHGARLAATSDPIASDISSMTGIGRGVGAGDSMPDFVRVCVGSSGVCSGGSYNSAAVSDLVFGPDHDNTCATNTKKRAGMCDIFSQIKAENVTVEYRGSGLGTAGYPGQPAPIITMRLTGLEYDFVFLDLVAPGMFKTMPDVEVSVMSEDLKTGS